MTDNEITSPNHQLREVTLSRDLSLFTITMIGVGGMIGAGIFALTGIAAGVAGPALVLVFLLNGIVTTLTAFSYAELASAFPEVGGGYIWVKESLGGTVEAFYYAFGDIDVLGICDLPDNVNASAFSLLVTAAGGATLKTTVLITPEEVDQATRTVLDYRPPGK